MTVEYEIYTVTVYSNDRFIGWKYRIHVCNKHAKGITVESFYIYKSHSFAIKAGNRFVLKLKAATYAINPSFI